MPFKIIRNDLTKVKTDVIVNTANPKPRAMSGTDQAIYDAAGYDQLLEERAKIGDIAPGEVAVTPAFNLKAKHIIHTVGPVWLGGEFNEEETLYSCYSKSLQKAVELKCKSVAFPLISTGIYGFPKDRALHIAINAISEFLLSNDMDVSLVVFDKESFQISAKLFQNIQSFIDENYVAKQKAAEYSPRGKNLIFASQLDDDFAGNVPALGDVKFNKSLGDFLDESEEETFQEKLFQLIDERGLTDVQVYKKANFSRKLFSKIRCNVDFQPNKKTALSLAIALELSLEETEDLLDCAGVTLSSSKKFDLIIKYFIINKNYDLFEINTALFEYNCPLLQE